MAINHDNDLIPSLELMNAILGLDAILGRAFAESIIEALEESGLEFSRSKRYSLNQIKKELTSIFGKEATELLMPRIRKNLA